MAERSARLTRWMLAVLALVGMLAYSANPLTQRAQAFAEQTATASAATYLSLRVVNAFLSTAQEIELGGTLVVSGTTQPLKWLEPVDDTIERIAGVVFGVMVATGVLAVALGPVGAGRWCCSRWPSGRCRGAGCTGWPVRWPRMGPFWGWRCRWSL